MTFHYVLRMAVAHAYFEMASRTESKELREYWLNRLVETANEGVKYQCLPLSSGPLLAT